MRFTTLLSKRVADTVEPLTDDDRINAFVIDDSLFERTSCKKTELGSRVFDHVSMKYCKGYRLMALGWTDGNTFLPVNSCLLASSKENNLIGPVCRHDGRSLAAKRRNLAQKKGTDVMIELLKTAQAAGHHADYVMFDTWFSSPAQLIAVKELGLDSIAMIKKSSRIYYEYDGKQLSINKIFGICKNAGAAANIFSLSMSWLGKTIRSLLRSFVSATRRTRKTGSPLCVRIRLFLRRRSSGYTEKGGRSRCSSKPASLIFSL
ncbi:MAG: transposase [Pseudobutyrivibrio sp.]|nr:transposase [Pseudobutyrivibrio sp.]